MATAVLAVAGVSDGAVPGVGADGGAATVATGVGVGADGGGGDGVGLPAAAAAASAAASTPGGGAAAIATRAPLSLSLWTISALAFFSSASFPRRVVFLLFLPCSLAFAPLAAARCTLVARASN